MSKPNHELPLAEGAVDCALDRSQLIEDLDRQFSKSGIRRRRRIWYRRAFAWIVILRLLAAVRRLFDAWSAVLLLLLLSPLLAALLVSAKRRGGGIQSITRLGRWGTTFRQYCFDIEQASPGANQAASGRSLRLAWLPSLWNVLRGEMALVGPRPVSPREVPASERKAWKRFDIRPGFISLWWIRKQANIAFSSEMDVDAEYAEGYSLRGDLGIALRALPAFAYGQGVSAAPDQFEILRIPIANLTMSEAVDQIVALAQAPTPSQLCFVNADCVNVAWRNTGYQKILARAALVLADGIGIRLAGRILNCHIRENVNGTDLFPMLCDSLREKELRLFLLGGRPGVPEAVAHWAKRTYPGLHIGGCQHGYFSAEEEPTILSAIREAKADVLLVAFGVPRQEEWISNRLAETGARVTIGVGGLFDFYSGRIPRAPSWMRELGLEWFYRFMQEPRRMWKRYFVGNAVFLCRVLWSRRKGGEGIQV